MSTNRIIQNCIESISEFITLWAQIEPCSKHLGTFNIKKQLRHIFFYVLIIPNKHIGRILHFTGTERTMHTQYLSIWTSFPCTNPTQQLFIIVNWHILITYTTFIYRHLQLFVWPHQSCPSSCWYGIPWKFPLHAVLCPCFSPSAFNFFMKCRTIS